MTLLIVEILNEFEVEETYARLTALIDSAPVGAGEKLHIAGESAIAGFLAVYIDEDARKLNPLAWLIIMIIFLVAYRRLSPALMANFIILAAVIISIGFMAGSGVPFFMITTALPVILIGISVADTIHIFSHYFQLQAEAPEREVKDLVGQTMLEMWRPVTLTSLTTIAGFLGLYLAAFMPPFRFFGLFAGLGVAVAWLYSLLVLPAAMVLIKPRVSRALRPISTAKEPIFLAVSWRPWEG